MARIFASKYLGYETDFSVNEPDYREMNASDERGIDVVRGRKVKQYCKTKSQNGKKRVLFLDEADSLTIEAQRALRAIMENNQENVVIIMSLNHLEGIKEKALLSRAMVFKYDPQPQSELKQYFLGIAKSEGISFKPEFDLNEIINFPEYRGDFRRIINDTLQRLVGIKHPVGDDDIPWIFTQSYTKLIEKILGDLENAFSVYWSDYRKRYIDPIIFLKQLFNEYREEKEMSYEMARIFATVEMNLKNGADSLVQMSYLLTALEEGI